MTQCDTSNKYWWVIPVLFVAAIAIRAMYRRVKDGRAARWYAAEISKSMSAVRTSIQEKEGWR